MNLPVPLGQCFEYGTLRSLRKADVAPMLEWMHDEGTARLFTRDFRSVTELEAVEFVRSSWDSTENVHLAVASATGSYLGTVSLKRLDWKNESAEYAIAMHPEGRGTGASLKGTHDLLELAFKELNLHRVYLCVRESNSRAKRFYEKAGFTYEGLARDAIRDGESFEGLEWWSILNGEL